MVERPRRSINLNMDINGVHFHLELACDLISYFVIYPAAFSETFTMLSLEYLGFLTLVKDMAMFYYSYDYD